MTPLFPRWSDTLFRTGAACLGLSLIGGPLLLIAWVRCSTATGESLLITQPIRFDHRHHVRDDGIDCLYCHGDARRSKFAGVPASSVCMGCHAQIWPDSPELEPVRDSFFRGKPLVWRRVDNLPEHVFFDHSIHVNKGVGCVSCHGRVDEMPSVIQDQTLLMGFCLDCHRHPEKHLRPRDEITNMEWTPTIDQSLLGRELVKTYDVHAPTDCTWCHR